MSPHQNGVISQPQANLSHFNASSSQFTNHYGNSSSFEWYSDTGTSHHVTPYLSYLSIVEDYTSKDNLLCW